MTEFAPRLPKVSPFNAERLPVPGGSSGLGLPLPASTPPQRIWLYLAIPAVIYSLPLFGLIFDREERFFAALMIGVVLVVAARFFFGIRNISVFAMLALGPLVVLSSAGALLDNLTDRRAYAALGLGLAVVLTGFISWDASRFYRGFLLADPAVPPAPPRPRTTLRELLLSPRRSVFHEIDQQAKYVRPHVSRRPILAPLVATAQAALLAWHLYGNPAYTTRWYTNPVLNLLIMNVVVLYMLSSRRNSPFPNALNVLLSYLTYGSTDPGAGGVWRYRRNHVARAATAAVLLAILGFAVPASLQWFRPHDQQVELLMPTRESITAALAAPDLSPEDRKAITEFIAKPPTVSQAERLHYAESLDEQARRIRQGWIPKPEEVSYLFMRPWRSQFTFYDPVDHFALTIFNLPKLREEFGLAPAEAPAAARGSLAAALSVVTGPVDVLQKVFIATPLVLAISFGNAFAIAPFLIVLLAPLIADICITRHRSTSGRRSPWENITDRLAQSNVVEVAPSGERIREADHIFIGHETESGAPVLLHRPLLTEHCYIVGDSGSGKTSLGMMPILVQLIRAGRDGSGGDRGGPAPIVILDLKGDSALFNTAREEAEIRGQEFRFFTLEKGQASNYFNPFVQYEEAYRTEIQICQLLLDSLSLNHGEGYGRGYYSKRNRKLLLDAIEHPSKPRTFKDLYTIISELAKADDFKEAFELIATVEALTKYDQLDARKDPEQTIHFPTALAKGQVVYFWLPAAIESVSAREISKLALFSLLSAAIDRQRRDPSAPRGPYYVFIDEFQRLAGENFKIILEQARSFGIAAILANQSVTDLRTPDADLRPTVQTNTRMKIFFSIQDAVEARALSDISGEEMAQQRSWSQSHDLTNFFRLGPDRTTESVTQSLKPRLTISDIRRMSDHPNRFVFFVSRGSGLSQFGGFPIVVSGDWPMTFETYRRRRDTPWPQKEHISIAELPAFLERMNAKLERMEAEERATQDELNGLWWYRLLKKLGLEKDPVRKPTTWEEVQPLIEELKKKQDWNIANALRSARYSREEKAAMLLPPEAKTYFADAATEAAPKEIDAEADRTARQHRAALVQEILEEKRRREGRGPTAAP